MHTLAEPVLQKFSPVSLDDMKAVRLMNRVDQKYMTSIERLPELLELISEAYHVQRIDGDAIAQYHTLYFDTPDLAMYTAHHNRKLQRQKLRVRCYRSSQTTFFEIKNKNNKKKTKKIRIPIPAENFYAALHDSDVSAFLHQHTPYSESQLAEQLENNFNRITLVDKGFNERVTIDSNITFHNRFTGIDFDMSKLVIIEVKHEVGAPPSPIEQALLALRIKPKRISKYCIGTLFTNPSAKYNRFKPKARYINTLTQNQCFSQNTNPHLS